MINPANNSVDPDSDLSWLSIDPPEAIYSKPLKESIFFTCQAHGTEDFPTGLRWTGPGGATINRADITGTDR